MGSSRPFPTELEQAAVGSKPCARHLQPPVLCAGCMPETEGHEGGNPGIRFRKCLKRI